MADELRNITNAALLAVLNTPLHFPCRILCRRGEAKPLLQAMRTKLSRERQEAERLGVEITQFFLTEVSYTVDPDKITETITVMRTLTKRKREQEYDFIRKLNAVTYADRRQLLYMLEHRIDKVLEDSNISVRDQIQNLGEQQNGTTFDAIRFKSGIAEINAAKIGDTVNTRFGEVKRITSGEAFGELSGDESGSPSDATDTAGNEYDASRSAREFFGIGFEELGSNTGSSDTEENKVNSGEISGIQSRRNESSNSSTGDQFSEWTDASPSNTKTGWPNTDRKNILSRFRERKG